MIAYGVISVNYETKEIAIVNHLTQKPIKCTCPNCFNEDSHAIADELDFSPYPVVLKCKCGTSFGVSVNEK